MKYYVWSGDSWVKCSKAKEADKGFLEYELADGTIGLARPSVWQKLVDELVEKKKRPVGRPLTGKAKIIISIDPEIRNAIDNLAKQAGLTRSTYIENLMRKFLQ